MSAGRLFSTALATFGVLAGGLVFAGAPAFGVVTYEYETQLTGLSHPWSLASNSSGDVFVMDQGGPLIDEFNASNALQQSIGSGVLNAIYVYGVAASDSAPGYVYAADSDHDEVFVFKFEGGEYKYLATWANPEFGAGTAYDYVAVDNSSGPRAGDVYVLNSGGTVSVVEPAEEGKQGNVLEELSAPGAGQVDGLAVSPLTGEVYVASPGEGVVHVFNDKGEPEEALSPRGSETPAKSFTPIAVAVDQTTGEIYVVDQAHNVVDKFSSEGAYVTQITGTGSGSPFGAPLGVAVNSNRDVYVSDGAAVDVFGEKEGEPPVVGAERVSDVTAVTVRLEGEVNPEGRETEFFFSYAKGSSCTGIGSVATAIGHAGNGKASVSESEFVPNKGAPALEPDRQYTFCLIAENAFGVTRGAEASFTIAATPPILGVGTASAITQSTATITATINPEGQHTVYKLDLGTSTAYGTPYPGDAGSGAETETVAFDLGGLQTGTTYHYRLVSANSSGIAIGPDQTFTTAAVAPTAPLALTVPETPAIVPFTALAFPAESATVSTPKALTNAQRLATALKACAKKPKKQRAACERQARKRYVTAKKKHTGKKSAAKGR